MTKAMQGKDAWLQLADALEALNLQNVEPILNRIKGMTSLFTMHPDDIAVLLNELGGIFSVGSADDKSLLLQQRMDEVRKKGEHYPIKKTLEREFGNLRVKWLRLYAPKDTETYPYGTVLVTEDDKYLYPVADDGWFLTSRGIVELPLFDIAENDTDRVDVQDALERFEKALYRVIPPLIPTHIVFDGHAYLITWQALDLADKPSVISADINEAFVVLDVQDEAVCTDDISQQLSTASDHVPPCLSPQQCRMDSIPMDAWRLDKPLPSAGGLTH